MLDEFGCIEGRRIDASADLFKSVTRMIYCLINSANLTLYPVRLLGLYTYRCLPRYERPRSRSNVRRAHARQVSRATAGPQNLLDCALSQS